MKAVNGVVKDFVSGGLKALRVCCMVIVPVLLLPVAIADDCSEGCRSQSRDGHFQILAMPAQGEVALRQLHDWVVNIQDAHGRPVELNGLSVTGGMPGHGHGLPSQPKVTEYLGEGRYRLTGFLFNMHGDWILRFHMGKQEIQDIAELTLTLDY